MYKKYPKGLTLTPDKEALVNENINIAHKLSHKWYNGVVDFEDIRQQAYLTLVDCATKFDPNNGNKFTTYAYSCIDLVLNNYVQNYNKIIKIPLNKIYKIHKYLQLPELEREKFRINNNLTKEDIDIYVNYEIVSIDTQVVDEYDDVTNFYPIEETGYESIDDNLVIKNIINNLDAVIVNEIDRNVFIDVINSGFEKTMYKEIAKKYKLKLKSIYEIIEDCVEIMKANKNYFI